MSDPGQELIQAVASEVAKGTVAPFAKMWSNAINGLIGDRIEEWRDARIAYRSANAAEVGKRAGALVIKRGTSPDSETPPEHIEEILEAASTRSEEELKDLFAKLLAGAVDPDRRRGYRRQFVATAKEMELLDAAAFPLLDNPAALAPSRREYVARTLNASPDEIQMSFDNLIQLGICAAYNGQSQDVWPFLTTYGRSFLKFVR